MHVGYAIFLKPQSPLTVMSKIKIGERIRFWTKSCVIIERGQADHGFLGCRARWSCQVFQTHRAPGRTASIRPQTDVNLRGPPAWRLLCHLTDTHTVTLSVTGAFH